MLFENRVLDFSSVYVCDVSICPAVCVAGVCLMRVPCSCVREREENGGSVQFDDAWLEE